LGFIHTHVPLKNESWKRDLFQKIDQTFFFQCKTQSLFFDTDRPVYIFEDCFFKFLILQVKNIPFFNTKKEASHSLRSESKPRVVKI